MRVPLLGVVTGLVWYYFSQSLFWRKLGVLIMIYSPPRPMLMGHVLFRTCARMVSERAAVLGAESVR